MRAGFGVVVVVVVDAVVVVDGLRKFMSGILTGDLNSGYLVERVGAAVVLPGRLVVTLYPRSGGPAVGASQKEVVSATGGGRSPADMVWNVEVLGAVGEGVLGGEGTPPLVGN
jgi:hypothetical protein